jgi:hypothetical protein
LSIGVTESASKKAVTVSTSTPGIALIGKSNKDLGRTDVALHPGQSAFADLDLGQMFQLKNGTPYGVTLKYLSGPLKGKQLLFQTCCHPDKHTRGACTVLARGLENTAVFQRVGFFPEGRVLRRNIGNRMTIAYDVGD